MALMDYARSMFGQISVEQDGDTIRVSGINPESLARDIKKTWNTSRLFQWLTSESGGRSLSFPAFFAPEFLYMFDHLATQRRLDTSRRDLANMVEGIKENTWIAEVKERAKDPNRVKRLDYTKLNKFIYKPLEYNVRYFEEYEQATGILGTRGSILAGAPGSGKTYMALAVAEMLHSDYIIVVCPKITLVKPWQFAAEAKDLYKVPVPYWMPAQGKAYNGERLLIVHYDAMPHLEKILDKLAGKKVTVILDESHHMNEYKTSARSKLFVDIIFRLVAGVRDEPGMVDVIWASGTPVKKQGSELIPFFLTTDPRFSVDLAERWTRAFGAEGKFGQDIIQNRMARIMSVVTKGEMKTAKPTVEYVPVKIPNGKHYTLDEVRKRMVEFIQERFAYYKSIEKEYIQQYDDAMEYFTDRARYGKSDPKEYKAYRSQVQTLRRATDYRQYGPEMKATNAYEKTYILPTLPRQMAKDFVNAKSAYKYLPLKIQGECLGRIVGRGRIDCVREIAESANLEGLINNSHSKTVIFSSYVDVVETVADKLKRTRQHEPMVLYGKNSGEIGTVLRKFGADEKANPLVTTYKSLSTGVPLIEASTEILMDPPFRPYILDQTISRVDRLGQTKPVFIYILILDTGDVANLSTRTKDIVSWAQEQVEAITGVKVSYDVAGARIGEGLEAWDDTVDDYVNQLLVAVESFAEHPVEVRASAFDNASHRW